MQARSGGRRGAVHRGRDRPGPRHRLVQADIRDPGPGRHHHWSLHTPPPRHTGTHCPHCHTRPSDGHSAQNDPLFRSQSSLLGLRSLVTGSTGHLCLLFCGGRGRLADVGPGPARRPPPVSPVSLSPGGPGPGLPLASGQCGWGGPGCVWQSRSGVSSN